MKLLLLPTTSAAVASPYRLSVEPGDVLVSKGADQLIVARVDGFEPDSVLLVSRFGADEAWRHSVMTAGTEPQIFEMFLFDLEAGGEYYVVAGGLRSAVYRIEVADLPSVRRIDLTYYYPAHTGLPPRQVVDGGDISAVHGSRVELIITPSARISGGSLVRNGRESLALSARADGTWSVDLEIDQEGYYRIDFSYGDGLLMAASPNYAIEVLPDRAPTARISFPGRDTRVTSVEEPIIEVNAADDLGIGQLELLYSVNGGPEQTVLLHGGAQRPTDVTASHTLFLEELGLRPGDLIAYYARARDSATTDGQRVTTDMFLMEVRPFERLFRQAQGGAGAGAMGGSFQRPLSAQQRQFVIATFKLARDRESYTEERFVETAELLARAEARIRQRVQAIIRRLGNRAVIQLQEGFQRMAEELPKAVESMREAEAALSERDPDTALPPARKALQHLQRAEAAFREVQVARAGAGGRGGAAADAEEDLANLFRLEMDKLRNQYEDVQRGQRDAAANALDETLEKLRELARRQQREVERLRRRAELAAGASSDARSQRALAEELEKVVRRLQRLSREQPSPELDAMLRQAQAAADAMRRAAAGANGDGLADAKAALERLREAQRVADKERRAQLRRQVAEALARARRMVAEQRDVAADVRGLPNEDEARAGAVSELQERKSRMAGEARDLETDLNRITADARQQQQAGARALRDAARSAREEQLPERIERSASALDDITPERSRRLESEIGAALDRLNAAIGAAADAIEQSGDQNKAKNLERMRDLVRGLESLRERIARQAGTPQESGDRSGASAGRDTRAGGSAIGGWGGRIDADGIAEFRREFTYHRADLEALAADLDRSEHGARDISALVARLRELEQARLYRDPQALLERQAALIAALKEMEFQLRQDEDAPEPRALVLSGNDEVPAGFRALVEEYFRELSRAATNESP